MTNDQNPGHGAPLPPPTIAYAVLTVLAVAVPTLVAGVKPWASDADLLTFVQDGSAIRLQALLTMAAAVPLAVLSAVVSDRIRVLGLQVPGRLIALAGGIGAAVVLAASSMVTLAMAQTASHHPSIALLRFGQSLTTALGGTEFAAFTGLLVAGIAVPGLLGRLLPPAVAWFGLVIAVVGELALLTTLTDAVDVALPITRFGSLLFLLVAAFTLRRRPRLTDR